VIGPNSLTSVLQFNPIQKDRRNMQWKNIGFVIFYSALNPYSYAFIHNVPMTSQAKSAMKASHDVISPHSKRTFYIRDARQSDLSQVAEILMLSFTAELYDPIRRVFEMCALQATFPSPGDQHIFLVACESSGPFSQNNSINGEEMIIGFIKVDAREVTKMHKTLIESFPQFKDVIPKTPYATDLAIHPEYRRRGVAKEIMREVELRVKNWTVESLFIGVEADNIQALDLYRDMGYEIFIEDMVGEGEGCVHLLRRTLNGNM
jgi:ribosomal protein S18 acetylase RimI-like enzyme